MTTLLPDDPTEYTEDELIRECYPWLSLMVYSRTTGSILDHDDLMQEACVALLGFARKWDKSMGVPFGGYVTPLMKLRLVGAQRESNAMWQSASRTERSAVVNAVLRQQETTGVTDFVAVAEQLNMPVGQVVHAWNMRGTYSLNRMFADRPKFELADTTRIEPSNTLALYDAVLPEQYMNELMRTVDQDPDKVEVAQATIRHPAYAPAALAAKTIKLVNPDDDDSYRHFRFGYTDSEKETILAEHYNGMRFIDVVAKYGVSPSVFSKWRAVDLAAREAEGRPVPTIHKYRHVGPSIEMTNAVLDRLADGVPLRRIQEELGLGERVVIDIRDNAVASGRTFPPPVNVNAQQGAERAAQARQMKADGMATKDIAVKLGVSKVAVRRYLRD